MSIDGDNFLLRVLRAIYSSDYGGLGLTWRYFDLVFFIFIG